MSVDQFVTSTSGKLGFMQQDNDQELTCRSYWMAWKNKMKVLDWLSQSLIEILLHDLMLENLIVAEFKQFNKEQRAKIPP